MPGTNLARVPTYAVAPSVPDARLGPDYKGNGGYVAPVGQQPVTTTASPILSLLMPASLSTSSASLSATAMFATQLLSQDAQPEAVQFLSEYEALVAASQVKYMPSNAALPEPPPNNLFAKMLAETQMQNVAQRAVQAAPKEAAATVAAAAAAPQAVQNARAEAPAAKPRAASGNGASNISGMRYAAHSYEATSVRNHAHLSDKPAVEAITG